MNSRASRETLDREAMAQALDEARQAERAGDVPVGAVIMADHQVVARARNEREASQDPTAHAEILVIRRAARAVGHWRLSGLSLFVTLEPCAMCAGAIVLARLDRLVFGAVDPKAGAVVSLYQLTADERLNHQVEVTPGVLGDEAGRLLRQFFQARRS